MLQKTKGLVVRAVRYGDTSLICTIFTSVYGVQAYMVQGVRSAKARQNRAGAFQPGTLLDLVVYQHPQKNLQRIREFQAAYIYSSIQEHIVKNSIVLFSVELLLRLLPEQAPLPALFDFVFDYFIALDTAAPDAVANFPLFFIIRCSHILGYETRGSFSSATPHLNMHEGGFSGHLPEAPPYVSDSEAMVLSSLLAVEHTEELKKIEMNAASRMKLIEWYLTFLKLHTEHMGNIKSLAVLQTILH